MAQMSCSDDTMIKSEDATHDGGWSEEHDCIPLKQRLKLLLASKRISGFRDNGSVKESRVTTTPPVEIVVKKEQDCDSQGSHYGCAAENGRNEQPSLEESHAGVPGESSCQGTQVNGYTSSNQISASAVHADTVIVEKVNVDASAMTLCQSSMPSEYNVKVKVECTDDISTNSLGNGLLGSSEADLQVIETKTKTSDDFEDDLDHVVLIERRRMLLSRKVLDSRKPVLEVYSSRLSTPAVEDTINCSVSIGDKKSHLGDGESSIRENPSLRDTERDAYDSCKTLESDSLNCTLGSSSSTSQPSPFTILANVNVEPSDIHGLKSLNKYAEGRNFPFTHSLVKSEMETIDMSDGDEVDHMLLSDRIKFMVSREVPNLDTFTNFKWPGKIMPSVPNCTPIASETAKPLRISRPRKKRKTATDSVETALEEDAPGLLQVLIGKGVALDEIKLYGEMESDEALDDSLSEDSFGELEDVISKLFFQRHSLLKLAPLRCTKGEKATYCLACLISLVEQARYLKFRKWPVEWGWCRDLQSFIFVFERHNRIVLERPEYGYATYFFELLDSLPVDWQIKRLVTSMKLPKCSRVTVVENKALVVGEDLSEGEARVLMDYGWIPNTGLGTMLNYCDRVVHDRKNESDDGSEWRSKIGKMLMNGYNG